MPAIPEVSTLEATEALGVEAGASESTPSEGESDGDEERGVAAEAVPPPSGIGLRLEAAL